MAALTALLCALLTGVSGTAGETEATNPSVRKRIVILGDSLTRGLGVDPNETFSAVLQDKIDAHGWNYQVVNAGQNGSTSAGGVTRLQRYLQKPIDVLILELGANDGLRGFPPETTRKNLQTIIDRTTERYPDSRIVIAGMQVPPNLGKRYAQDFKAIFAELARENDALLIPFLLEGVGGDPELNQNDQIHPNARGHQVIADNVWQVLTEVLDPDSAPSKATAKTSSGS